MRLEFRLSMPGRGSWNGGWSGENRNYTIVRSYGDQAAAKILRERSYHYSWPDGWGARVDVRVLNKGERSKKSDGFHGYDWMIDSIERFGKIYASHQEPAATKD